MGSAWSVEPVAQSEAHGAETHGAELTPGEAETLLVDLAAVFLGNSAPAAASAHLSKDDEEQPPNVSAIYRALVEQIPAVVFMAHLDRGIGEAYVSPQIQASLGFSQAEWLEDPIRWYQQIHPDDKQRVRLHSAHPGSPGLDLSHHSRNAGGIEPWPSLSSLAQPAVRTPRTCGSGWSGRDRSLSNTTSKPIRSPGIA
jgi:PAS domain-containing protein